MKHDLDLYVTDRQALPGFFAVASTKRCARGREDDSLIVFLAQKNGEELALETLKKWFETLSSLFYNTAGSVTSAMRAIVNALNTNLMELNLKLTERSEPNTAALLLAVIHHDTLFAAQAGIAQAMVLQAGQTRLLFDQDLDERGLGSNEIPQLRFFQEALGDNAVILLSVEFPTDWQAGQLENVSPDLYAIQERIQKENFLPAPIALVQAKLGTGILHWIEPTLSRPEEHPVPEIRAEIMPENLTTESEAAESLEPVPLTQDEKPEAEAVETTEPSVEITTPVNVSEGLGEAMHPTPNPTVKAESPAVPRGLHLSEQEPEKQPRGRKAAKAATQERKRAAYSSLAAGAGKMNQMGEGFGSLFKRKKAAPNMAGTEKEELSPATKLFLAVIVPIIVVALVSVIYITQGKENQYEYLMEQARAAAENAPKMSDATLVREGWNQVLVWLDQAEEYRQTSELRALRVQAQNALDQLDGALRLSYKPAYAGSQLPSLQISRMLMVGDDLYLLDQTTGVVLRMTPSSGAYSLDLEFKCGAGTYNGIQVGNLVEMMSVPINNVAKAPIFALDSAGHGIFCKTKETPTAMNLISPDSGWGKIQSALFESGQLFVLDPLKNAIWIYRGANMAYTTPPNSYFEGMTVDLSRAVSMALSGDELFILFEDGHTTHCLASNVTGLVTCEDPYLYQDARTAAASQLDFSSLHFSQLAYSTGPDPSLYYLEPDQAELYQFSLRLNLNRILRAEAGSGSLPHKAVTAFTVSTNRVVFLAFGNEVYYAAMP